MQCGGSEWEQELLFEVERTHPEIQRLEGRYKKYAPLATTAVVMP